MSDINKTMLINDMAQRASVSNAAAEKVLDAFIATIKEYATSGDRVVLRGFGSFSAKESKARTGRNPHTGEAINVPASRSVKFKAYGKL